VAGKPSRYITNRQSQLSLTSFLGTRVPVCLAEVESKCVHLCRVTGNIVRSYMAGDAP